MNLSCRDSPERDPRLERRDQSLCTPIPENGCDVGYAQSSGCPWLRDTQPLKALGLNLKLDNQAQFVLLHVFIVILIF